MFNEKVMIVDANQRFLNELEEILVLSGYYVTPFINPDVLFNSLLFVKPDIILLDIPSQYQEITRGMLSIKENAVMASIPVIGMLDHVPDRIELSKLKYCGIEEYIKKPFRPLDIIARIEQALSQRQQYTRLSV